MVSATRRAKTISAVISLAYNSPLHRRIKNEKRQTLSHSGAREASRAAGAVYLREVPRVLLQLSRDRDHAARYRAAGEALRARLRRSGGTLHEVRPQGKGAPAATQEGQGVRHR